MFLNLIKKILAILAKKTIKKYKPIVVGITGSVGKSSTKEAIYTVLKKHIFCWKNIKNYNNEIGLPLTILGYDSPGNNIFLWLKIFCLSFLNLVFKKKNYPKALILEMAADRIGDIDYLVDIALPSRGVITAISPAHSEFLGGLDSIANEKQSIIKKLSINDWAILNADDERIIPMKQTTQAKTITFGNSIDADISVINSTIEQDIKNQRVEIKGIRLEISYKNEVASLFLPKMVSLASVYSVLAAISVGITFNIKLKDMVNRFKHYKLLNGRMRPIKGIKNTLIIDDTYNSSPRAAISALNTIAKINVYPGAKKWIIMGDMKELGALSKKSHYEVGQLVAGMNFDYLITIGEESRILAQGAEESGMREDNIFSFHEYFKVIPFLKERLRSGDIVLIKGSQLSRMERIVKGIMINPNKAKDLLVRQTSSWL